MERFLVIGASGFIGRHVLNALANRPNSEVLGTRLRESTGNLIRFDIATQSIIDQLSPHWRQQNDNSWAILCAAVVPMDRCATEPAHARAVMVDGTRRCITELAQLGYRPVFLSTSYVFDGVSGGYAEGDPTRPISRYGELKRELESHLEADHRDALILRLDKTASSNPTESHLLSEWEGLGSRGEPIVCIENQQFGLTDVRDVAETVYQSCRRQLTGCFHVANPVPSKRDQLAARFIKVMGLDTEVRVVPLDTLGLPEPRPLRSWLVSDKIQQALGVSFTATEDLIQEYRRRRLRGA